MDENIKRTELPGDVVRWVSKHFETADLEPALAQLRSAVIHTGEPASSRLLRCAVFSSGGDLRRLEQQIRQLRVDWRDVIVAGERSLEEGKFVTARDFNEPMDDI